MNICNPISYGLGSFLLGLCLVVGSIYFIQARQELSHIDGQVQQLQQLQPAAQLKAKAEGQSKPIFSVTNSCIH